MPKKKQYQTEREGQIDFFDNYRIPYDEDNSVLVDNTDGVWHGNLLEFKLHINNTGKVLFQAIKNLSRMRIKGESVPATILLIDLNDTKVYVYHSADYLSDIQKIYVGAASVGNDAFSGNVTPFAEYDYSDMVDSAEIYRLLINRPDKPNKVKGETEELKRNEKWYVPVDIDEDCIVGWAERYYREIPTATKGDFLGDDTGTVKIVGEIREPRHFKGLINPYEGKTNEKFVYLMDCLNSRLAKKDLGAFYTPMPYARKAAELVEKAVERVPDGNDYIILDRCAGTGNLESALIGLYDRNGDELISHCVVSTYEYYEYKVLLERIGDKVRNIIPPTEANVVFENGCVSNADAMSEEYINNPLIRRYVDNERCTIILFENPPYRDIASQDKTTIKQKTWVYNQFVKHGSDNASHRDISNLFIWSGVQYYLRQSTDSYVVFSPVKYFKSLSIINLKFEEGFAFNRKYFHATDSVITCVRWSNIIEPFTNGTLTVFGYDGSNLISCPDICVKKIHGSFNPFNDKRQFGNDKETVVTVNNGDGYESGKKVSKRGVCNDNIIGYLRATSFNLNPNSRCLTRTITYDALTQSYGFYLRKDNYLQKLPLWVAKLYPQDEWYEKDVYNTTSDGGDAYTHDPQFLKSCLIYTCLSNQNKCLSFTGSDGRYYRNELCFDTTHGDTCASHDLARFAAEQKTALDDDEKSLLEQWNRILEEAKKTDHYDSSLTYGVYQITKELNTSYKEGTGKNKKTVYDYPTLNGYLVTLRDDLKRYYKSHITEKMFKYELLK